MGDAYEVIGGRVTNPGGVFTALTMNTNDSLTVRNFPLDRQAFLYQLWAEGAAGGVVRVRSPRLHDNVQGLRARYLASTPAPLIPDEARQQLYPQDVLTAEMTGGAAETDAAYFQILYRDLPGIDARLFSWPDLVGRIRNILTQEVATASSGTAGDWSGGTAINATFDLLKANTDYAILGWETDVRMGAVGVRGPDTGNLRLGGPGILTPIETRRYFIQAFEAEGVEAIPVINSANKGATFVHVSDPAVAAAVNVVLHLAELEPGLGR